MAEAIGHEPVMIMEGVARLDFCDTKIVATMLLSSPPSVVPGGAVHQCTEHHPTLHILTSNTPQTMNHKSTTTKSNLKTRPHNGRPSLPEKEKQSIIRHTRYNVAEDSVLLANVSRAGLKNVSEYIRQVSLNPHIVPRLSETEMAIARKLSGMSNNFNQLLRLCHQRGLDAMSREVEYYLGKFRELFAKFNND